MVYVSFYVRGIDFRKDKLKIWMLCYDILFVKIDIYFIFI